MKRILACTCLTLLGTFLTVTTQAVPIINYVGNYGAELSETDTICPKCHHENSPSALFCSECGALLKADGCPHCGASIKPGDKFCSQCGFDLSKMKKEEADAKEQTAKDQTVKEQAVKTEPTEPAESTTESITSPQMRIIGFMDTGFHSTSDPSVHDAFRLGEFDLFMTSRIAENMSVLAETVIAPDTGSNVYGIEVERILLNYHVNDHLNVGFGRYHTHVGYYSTAYHHGTVLQTAATRPFLFRFEDDGGPLPIHNVGVVLDGPLGSGMQNLRWVAEVGNGRTSTSLAANPVQNFATDKDYKAVNLALIGHPDSVPGLEYGASIYHDRLVPTGMPAIAEWIATAHVVYQNPNFEWLNEAVLISHTPSGMQAFNTPGFYSQIGKQYGLWRPYARYEYINSPFNEPFRPDIGLMYGPRLGVKYDLNAFANVKFEYDHTSRGSLKPFDEIFSVVGFTF